MTGCYHKLWYSGSYGYMCNGSYDNTLSYWYLCIFVAMGTHMLTGSYDYMYIGSHSYIYTGSYGYMYTCSHD